MIFTTHIPAYLFSIPEPQQQLTYHRDRYIPVMFLRSSPKTPKDTKMPSYLISTKKPRPSTYSAPTKQNRMKASEHRASNLVERAPDTKM